MPEKKQNDSMEKEDSCLLYLQKQRMKKVAITGIGLVSPFGVGKEKIIPALKNRVKVKPSPVPEFAGTPLESQVAGSIPDLLQAAREFRKMSKYMSDAAILTALAGNEAASEASINRRFDLDRVGIYSATGLTAAKTSSSIEMLMSCVNSEGKFSEELFGKVGLGLMNPLDSFKILPNMPSCILSILLGIKGPNIILNPWEDQAGSAIFEGFMAVAEGEVDCALVGASDTPSYPFTMVYLRHAGLINEHEFPSSAGAYLALESEDKATKDGQHIYAFIDEITVKNTAEKAFDPLSSEIGRTYVAAPAMLMALNALNITEHTSLTGTRGTSFSFTLSKK